MDNVERVADDLYFLKYVHREGTFVGITVVLGRRAIGLVDTGFEPAIVDHLFPFLRDVGRRPDEITVVVNTHRDGDHIQGNPVLKAQTKATFAAHELDADAIGGIDVRLHDGDQVDLGDRTFEVVHAPGHTPGNICLYQPGAKLLIVGDTLCGDHVNLIRMGKDLYINSIKRLLDLDVQQLIQSHPRKPIEKGVLVGDEPRQMMLASIALAEQST
jgi:glyoxylase-like metal-dependent hydrolase (beta-lactamase superfamily II)